MTDHCRMLVVDDEEAIRRLFHKEMAGASRSVETAADGTQARRLIQRRSFEVAVLDVCLPDGDGLELLSEFKKTAPDMEVILITGYGKIPDAVEAMRRGAYDYITKPFELDRLEFVVEKAFERARLQRENRVLKKEQQQAAETHLVGQSARIRDIDGLIDKVAPTDVPVLITGQSGSGKDVVARRVHEQSHQRHRAMIIKNCGTLQRELVRSELFGHIKGAFTGADQHQEGLLEMADGSTMFLDEVGDLPLEVQSTLLRVLETQTFRKVGAKEERQVSIRFLFATNRDLATEVQEGRFNEALFHRINVFQINTPELRERKEDLPLLIEHFLARLAPQRKVAVSETALSYLRAYDWPGNVRELRNVLERCLILCEGDVITEHDLPGEITKVFSEALKQDGWPSLERLEKNYIAEVLEYCRGNRSQASAILGISRKTLYRKLKQ